MKVSVITFPGSNCDYDGYQAFKQVGADVEFRWHREEDLGDTELVFLPGGFSYGDYLRPGAIAHLSPIMEAVRRFADRGGAVIGVCNGFQILCESGLLPGALMTNHGRSFRSMDVHLKVENADTPFTHRYAPGQVLRVPIAHADGAYYADPETLARLEGAGCVVFRYCSPTGSVEAAFNPNGSLNEIAGIVNERGNVLGMMPHPERAMEPLLGSADGVALFESLTRVGAPSA